MVRGNARRVQPAISAISETAAFGRSRTRATGGGLLLDLSPDVVAHDCIPGYRSKCTTRLAGTDVERIAVKITAHMRQLLADQRPWDRRVME